jgi:hypothetical protein
LESSRNHAWNAASDVSASGAAVRSNMESLLMRWVSVGILSGAMSYKAFKRGTMQSNTTASLDVKTLA